MREQIVSKIYDLAKMNDKVVFIGSDVGHIKQFKKEFPERYFMEGISEQSIVGMAAGLALEGFIPYILTISTFLTRRCLEQIIVDISLHNLPIRLIGFGGGVAYAPLGPTHWAVDDFNILKSIPNMTILAPCDEYDSCKMMEKSLSWPHPLYLRMGKGEDHPVFDEIQDIHIGKPILLKKDGEILLITCGTMTQRALDAVLILNMEDSVQVLHVHTIKPICEKSFIDAISSAKKVITIEEHSIVGGLGSTVAEIIAENAKLREKISFFRLALPDQILRGYGTQSELLKKYHLDADAIAKYIQINCIGKDSNVSLRK